MKIKFILVLFIIFFILIGCQNNNLNLEDVTKIEVYNWEDNVLLKTFEDTSFIKNIVTKLNNANGKKISDTADVSAPEYKVIFRKNEEVIKVLGLYQAESEANYVDNDIDYMYTIDLTIPIK